ncbi:4-(cytidine 5'-diphospho)-2-C-methyl-D-erythritol kinase [Cognatishimia sp. F0-27]|nr:4-(cytidine 5'-diphospho)-2-C-methyl-D-erythritol kinase [Cognatishimia sp. F0-27]MCC1494181.1 4-(cytidine 5'-diphospho)-2-C-methyl-D-erythritol kinase [Cognatishimia sp. F0-27]
MKAEAFAPAKINLALHVTGQRADGYHLLDSLVAFADVGDTITVARAARTTLAITGPMAAGIPATPDNLCWRAADAFDAPVAITLDKHLPASAGIGGGSSDAAATLRAMAQLCDAPPSMDPAQLGADVPVCMLARGAHMHGIGEAVTPIPLPSFPAVLVNPCVAVSTPEVFRRLAVKTNAAMDPFPRTTDRADWLDWLQVQRNDLERPAIAGAPVIADVLHALRALPQTRLVRMSGSGATCVALCDAKRDADAAASALSHAHPDWWVTACILH